MERKIEQLVYGREAVRPKLKNSQKHKKCIFWLFLSFCRTASRPYRLSQINALRINQSYYPKDQSIKFSQNFFTNISGIRPWISRIDWWEDRWCCTTYIVERLSDISSKTDKKCIFCVFRLFLPLCV